MLQRRTTILFIGGIFAVHATVTDMCERQTGSNMRPSLTLPPLRVLHRHKAKIGTLNLVSVHCNNKHVATVD